MSKIKIGINGFGRIGRITFRAALKRDDVEVVAINDLLDVNHLAYLLKYDSVHGKLEDSIQTNESNLVVNGKSIRITSERDPSKLPWGKIGADIVLECTGFFLDKKSAGKHIEAGAKKIIFNISTTAGAKDKIIQSEVISKEIIPEIININK